MFNNIIDCKSINFDKCILDSSIPVCVFFYGNNCPPCHHIMPLFMEIASIYKDKMKFVKIEAWENADIADKYYIDVTPTIIFIDKKIETGNRLVNPKSKTLIINEINKILNVSNKKAQKEIVECDVIILGGGPAGLSAAIFTSRANLRTVLIDEAYIGGQVITTYNVANYPGTDGPVSGSNLIKNMLNQAKSFGTNIEEFKTIERIDIAGNIKKIITKDTEYYSKSVIIATGASPRKLPVKNEEIFRGRGIHYCAICDGATYKDKKLIVVGGGDSATEEALYLSKIARKVIIVHQFDHFQASKLAQENIFSNNNIDIIWNSEIVQLNGDRLIKSVLIEDVKTKKIAEIEVDGVFVYIGMEPQNRLFKEKIKLNSAGNIITDDEMQTNISGVFAAGDIREKKVRQIGTAVSDGIIAGIMCEKYIINN